MLLLVSVPSDKTESGFMSKYVTWSDLTSDIKSTFKLSAMEEVVSQVSSQAFPIFDGLSANTLKCDLRNPYVISSISQRAGNITELSGYRLSAALDTLHSAVPMQKVLAREFVIAGYSEDPPVKSLLGSQLVKYDDVGGTINVVCGHKTVNCFTHTNGTSGTKLAIQLKSLEADAEAQLSATSLEFKLLVDNAQVQSVGVCMVELSGLSSKYTLVSQSTASDLAEVQKGEISLYVFMQVADGMMLVEKTKLQKI